MARIFTHISTWLHFVYFGTNHVIALSIALRRCIHIHQNFFSTPKTIKASDSAAVYICGHIPVSKCIRQRHRFNCPRKAVASKQHFIDYLEKKKNNRLDCNWWRVFIINARRRELHQPFFLSGFCISFITWDHWVLMIIEFIVDVCPIDVMVFFRPVNAFFSGIKYRWRYNQIMLNGWQYKCEKNSCGESRIDWNIPSWGGFIGGGW